MNTDRSLNRRDVLKLSAVSTAGGLLGSSGAVARQAGADEPQSTTSILRTPLCDLLGITYPVLQAPMASVVTPEMVAEVGRAGGLGILPGAGVPPDELRKRIRRIKELAGGRPFGVNLILHPAMRTPLQPAQISAETSQAIQRVLNQFRTRVGLAAAAPPTPAVPAIVDEAFDVILDERVPVFSVGVGKPSPEMIARCRAQGIKVISMIATVPDAMEVAALGADAIVAQGGRSRRPPFHLDQARVARNGDDRAHGAASASRGCSAGTGHRRGGNLQRQTIGCGTHARRQRSPAGHTLHRDP
jgi:hypothetical protein